MFSKSSNYHPDPEVQNKIKHEIEEAFNCGSKSPLEDMTFDAMTGVSMQARPTLPDLGFIEACAKVGVFLRDKDAVVKQLIKLNEMVAENLFDDQHKVKNLRKVLENELGRLGFHPNFGKAFGRIAPDAFRAAIAHGLFFKDVALGHVLHGEFIHAIQWLVIAWQQETTNFLGCPAVTIFKRLGNEESVYIRAPIKKDDDQIQLRQEKNIWDLIVDRNYGADENDFRNPENLMGLLIYSDDEKLVILKKILDMRYSKRSKAFKDDSDILNKKCRAQPNTPYHLGELSGTHEPYNLAIDLKAFRKRP